VRLGVRGLISKAKREKILGTLNDEMRYYILAIRKIAYAALQNANLLENLIRTIHFDGKRRVY
jgi:hypothetical protein